MEIYKFLMDTFGACVTGKSTWNKMAPKKLLKDFFTFTDEALMLWFLENNYEVWTEDWKYKIGGTLNSRNEVPRPLYTEQSKVGKKTGGKDQTFCGWNSKGICLLYTSPSPRD